jgi:hypothetical protein
MNMSFTIDKILHRDKFWRIVNGGYEQTYLKMRESNYRRKYQQYNNYEK